MLKNLALTAVAVVVGLFVYDAVKKAIAKSKTTA